MRERDDAKLMCRLLSLLIPDVPDPVTLISVLATCIAASSGLVTIRQGNEFGGQRRLPGLRLSHDHEDRRDAIRAPQPQPNTPQIVWSETTNRIGSRTQHT